MAIRHLCSADVWSPEVRTTGDGGFFGLWKPENPAQGPRGHPAGLQRALGSRGVMWRRVPRPWIHRRTPARRFRFTLAHSRDANLKSPPGYPRRCSIQSAFLICPLLTILGLKASELGVCRKTLNRKFKKQII